MCRIGSHRPSGTRVLLPEAIEPVISGISSFSCWNQWPPLLTLWGPEVVRLTPNTCTADNGPHKPTRTEQSAPAVLSAERRHPMTKLLGSSHSRQ
jgi:hypothetical protein